MPQRFERLDLGLEPLAKALGIGEMRRQRLDRHALAGFGIDAAYTDPMPPLPSGLSIS